MTPPRIHHSNSLAVREPRSAANPRSQRWLAAVVLLAAFGCGGSSSEFDTSVLVPVTGRVTLDGKPAQGVAVVFHPKLNTVGTGAFAVTDENGSFTLDHRSGEQGVEPGGYAVTFSRYTQPDGSPIPPGASAADVGAVESMPKQYTDATNPRLPTQADVSAVGGTFEFELTSQKLARR